MKYFKLTFDYLKKKNILYVLLFAVVPTIFIGALLRPFALFEFICNYPSMVVTGFGSIFNSLFSFTFLDVFLFILGIFIVSIFVSMMIGQLENHMRSGKINLKSSITFLNNNFLVVFVNLLILIILLFVQIAAIFLLNIPNMLINGYPAKQAFSNSLKLLNTNNFSFLLALILPFVIIIPLVCVFCSIAPVVANIIGVLILFIYIPVLVMTSYFSLSNTTRYDNRKYYNYNN